MWLARQDGPPGNSNPTTRERDLGRLTRAVSRTPRVDYDEPTDEDQPLTRSEGL
jgi:hypothetical protein